MVNRTHVTLTANTTLHFDENVKTSISGKFVLPGPIPAGLGISLLNSAAGKTFHADVNADGSFTVEHLPQAVTSSDTPKLHKFISPK